MRSITILVLCLILAAGLSFCGKKESPEVKAQKEAEKTAENFAESMAKAADEAGSATDNAYDQFQKTTEAIKKQSEAMQGGEITVAGRDTLIDILPKPSGWEMGEPRYSKNAMGGVEISTLSVDYTRGDETVEMTINDAGTMSSMLMPVKMALQMNISHEDDDEIQKISQVNGIPVIEKMDKKSGESELSFIYKERYVFNLNGEGKDSLNTLKKFCGEFKLSKLD